MQDKWAALLANAADPETAKDVKPVYVDILKQITLIEAQILENMYLDVAEQKNLEVNPYQIGFRKEKLCKLLNIESIDFDIFVDNLFRLNLVQPPRMEAPHLMGGPIKFEQRSHEAICLTVLGYNFVKACRYTKFKKKGQVWNLPLRVVDRNGQPT